MNTVSASAIGVRQDGQLWQARLAMFGLASLAALCLLAGAGGTLRTIFSPAALVVGLYLYWRHPVEYVEFVWWMWFVTPLLRRLVDYESGWVDPNPIMLAPFLVTMIAALTVVRRLGDLAREGRLPFVLAGAGVLYGFGVGLIKNAPNEAARELLSWLAPLVFGFHLLANWRDYEALRDAVRRTFLWGGLLMGAYGVWQFVVAPAWDGMWLENVGENVAAGYAVPYGIRVWSTLNAPAPFGVVMMACLIVMLSSRSFLRWPAALVGYVSFLLSLVRMAWVGWAVALLCYLVSLRARLGLRLVAAVVLIVACATPLLMVEPFGEIVFGRLRTLTDVGGDFSYNVRMRAYGDVLGRVAARPAGTGLGIERVVSRSEEDVGMRDSGLLHALTTLGWLGSALYAGALALIVAALWWGGAAAGGGGAPLRADAFFAAARAVVTGVCAQLLFGSVMLDVSGAVLWGFVGLALSARVFYHARQSEEQA